MYLQADLSGVSPQKLAVAISALCNLLRGNAEGVSELFVDQCYSANAAVAHAYFQARRLSFALHLSLCTSLTCTQSLPSSTFPFPMHSHVLKRICNMPYCFREKCRRSWRCMRCTTSQSGRTSCWPWCCTRSSTR